MYEGKEVNFKEASFTDALEITERERFMRKWLSAITGSPDSKVRSALPLANTIYLHINLAKWSCSPSRATISEKCSVHRRTVDDWIKALRDAGYLRVASGRGKPSSKYLPTLPGAEGGAQ